ncbi:hypothetical protein JCM3765_004280 [Sporobolomyces pararoseus]
MTTPATPAAKYSLNNSSEEVKLLFDASRPPLRHQEWIYGWKSISTDYTYLAGFRNQIADIGEDFKVNYPDIHTRLWNTSRANSNVGNGTKTWNKVLIGTSSETRKADKIKQALVEQQVWGDDGPSEVGDVFWSADTYGANRTMVAWAALYHNSSPPRLRATLPFPFDEENSMLVDSVPPSIAPIKGSDNKTRRRKNSKDALTATLDRMDLSRDLARLSAVSGGVPMDEFDNLNPRYILTSLDPGPEVPSFNVNEHLYDRDDYINKLYDNDILSNVDAGGETDIYLGIKKYYKSISVSLLNRTPPTPFLIIITNPLSSCLSLYQYAKMLDLAKKSVQKEIRRLNQRNEKKNFRFTDDCDAESYLAVCVAGNSMTEPEISLSATGTDQIILISGQKLRSLLQVPHTNGVPSAADLRGAGFAAGEATEVHLLAESMKVKTFATETAKGSVFKSLTDRSRTKGLPGQVVCI